MCIGKNICGHMRLRTAVTVLFALAWWGILYPELCFTEETYQQVVVEDGQEKVVEGADCKGLLAAGEEEIVIKSRLLEWLEEQKWFQHDGQGGRRK